MAKTLPVMLLKDFVILPNQEVKLELNHPLSAVTLKYSTDSFNREIIIVSPKDTLEEVPDVEDLPGIAVVAKIKTVIPLDQDRIRLTILGESRVKIEKYFNSKFHSEILECECSEIELPKVERVEELAVKKELRKLVSLYIKSSPQVTNQLLQTLKEEMPLTDFTDCIASFLPATFEGRVFYMEEMNPLKRANQLLEDLTVELQVLKLDKKINIALQKEMEQNQKEFVLRGKLKEIQKELGDENPRQKEIEQYYEKLNSLEISSSLKSKALYEIHKYEFMNDSSPEITFVRNYLDLFFSLPWNEETIEASDLVKIEKALNKTHYGLKKVKQRILEYAAMKVRNPMLQAPILCFVGPPGVGKSTIASSIANALHRKFAKISVGGLNDSAELLGHRRTYLGSAPGKIIQSLQKCGSKNPVLLIDEVDKMVKDYKGDPASVLLDILDPNLNQNFMDSYLEEPFDLSHVLFILTANRLDDIPIELRDRLEIIELSSYTIFEKISVAKDYLLPMIYEEYHVSIDEIQIEDDALKELILNYTNEAGVRDLKRKLEAIYRKLILMSMKNRKNLQEIITTKELTKILEEHGNYNSENLENTYPGYINGLAVTNNGGSVLPIEATYFDGTGKLHMTGMLGDIMKESLNVVMSYVKANAKLFEINENYFQTKDIHFHVLEGAIPKNGPSAGVAITTSIISLLTNKAVDSEYAMTGEMSLRGVIYPVGGIKEKVIGAYNKGMKVVFLPEQNRVDTKEIPKEILSSLKIVYVKNYTEIFEYCFLNKKIKRR